MRGTADRFSGAAATTLSKICSWRLWYFMTRKARDHIANDVEGSLLINVSQELSALIQCVFYGFIHIIVLVIRLPSTK